MDHHNHDHDYMVMTATMASEGAATTAAHDMSGGGHHDHDHGGMGGCKISMLWNWNTIDSCFIAQSWRITSAGMFAGSCIGVILLVMSLELLRRSVKEYDRYLIRSHAAKYAAAARPRNSADTSTSGYAPDGKGASVAVSGDLGAVSGGVGAVPGFRPSVLQQAIRALLHMLQFAVAYFVMLLAMYYNGYFIICIFIGAYLGSFVFHWEVMGGSTGQTSATENPTVCCG
ncbi:hypothetical protein ACRALDRAFT_1075306 [Sodiomyces alcalophilus JCM 7366]|uniref:uncharacterized protein n=1 Tax=Sodiomyces alcalophilus JCM 7366 TaxID=591952 RepID=UPI0039B4A94B